MKIECTSEMVKWDYENKTIEVNVKNAFVAKAYEECVYIRDYDGKSVIVSHDGTMKISHGMDGQVIFFDQNSNAKKIGNYEQAVEVTIFRGKYYLITRTNEIVEISKNLEKSNIIYPPENAYFS